MLFLNSTSQFILDKTKKNKDSNRNYSNCGVTFTELKINGNQLNRIINGEDSNQNSWPWVVSLRILTNSAYNHYCGGTLISSWLILTAAHCLHAKDISKIIIMVGVNNLDDPMTVFNAYYISSIKIHPAFSLMNLKNDIGIIKVDRKIDLSEKVFPICLPFSNGEEFIYNKKVVVTGW